MPAFSEHSKEAGRCSEAQQVTNINKVAQIRVPTTEQGSNSNPQKLMKSRVKVKATPTHLTALGGGAAWGGSWCLWFHLETRVHLGPRHGD